MSKTDRGEGALRPARRSGPYRTHAPRIAYVTTFDAKDVRAWSGTVHHIARSMEEAGVQVDHMGELQRPRVLLNKAINKLVDLASPGSLYPIERTMRMARLMAAQIQTALERSRCDVVFSPGSIPLALLKTPLPKVFYTDATFAGILDLYPEYAKYPKRYIKEGHDLEQAALRNSDLVIYSSAWAADTAREHYEVDERKLRVIPFGGNLSQVPKEADMLRAIRKRSTETCELIFLAVSWQRKGGAKALEVARQLDRRGVPVRLRIVGCVPPVKDLPSYAEVHPFINKHSAAGERKLAELLGGSHLLLLPTVADCTPIVFPEANAFGVPCLTHAVGGVSDVVRDGVNGRLFTLRSAASTWADAIEELMNDRPAYDALAVSSLREYHDRLNWRTTVAALRACLEELL